MADIQLSLSYANPNSGPQSARIGWINWNNFSLAQDETASVSITAPNGIIITFDVTNTTVAGNGLTILSDVPIPNSAFGTLGYTNISGNIALEGFTDYNCDPLISDSSRFTISNILVRDSSGKPINSYSFVLPSIQVANGQPLPIGTKDIQTFTTSGGNWAELAFLGNTSSPLVNTTNPKSITIYPISNNSGSPVYTTSSPREVLVTISGCTLIPQFAIGIIINQIRRKKKISEPTRGANLFKN